MYVLPVTLLSCVSLNGCLVYPKFGYGTGQSAVMPYRGIDVDLSAAQMVVMRFCLGCEASPCC